MKNAVIKLLKKLQLPGFEKMEAISVNRGPTTRGES